MRDMAKAYGKWIIAAVILFLAAVGGYLYWQNRQQQQAATRQRGHVGRDSTRSRRAMSKGAVRPIWRH